MTNNATRWIPIAIASYIFGFALCELAHWILRDQPATAPSQINQSVQDIQKMTRDAKDLADRLEYVLDVAYENERREWTQVRR